MIDEKIAGPVIESKVSIACFKAIAAQFEVLAPVVLANDICYESGLFKIPITWHKMRCR
jgi:hypothetical protein